MKMNLKRNMKIPCRLSRWRMEERAGARPAARVAASSESKAAKEKRELKENLARVKASMKETAADREKERGADLLRQMDPGEQERILREVLKEFLS